MQNARSGHKAVLLADGRVLVVAGGQFSEPPAELYDPQPGTWSPTGPMINDQTQTTGHSVTLLQDGRVLVAGGSRAPAAAELYDPATNTWSATGNLQTARSGHTGPCCSPTAGCSSPAAEVRVGPP
jgi:hypothetical protein